MGTVVQKTSSASSPFRKGTLHIHLINLKDRMFSEFQKNPDSLKSCYWCRCFIIVFFCLRVTFCNQYDFVPRTTKSSSSSFFLNTHQMPITVLSFVIGYQLQCYLPFNSTEFILLCNHSIRINQSFFNFLRFFLR